MRWYFAEILPLFMIASVLIWAGKLTGLFALLTAGLRPLMWWLGLPHDPAGADAADVFLYGFFRRDFGAGGLYDLNAAGALDGRQLVVASVVLTLFLPCIAQFLVMGKERGWKITLGTVVFIFVVSIIVGGLLNLGLGLTGARF
jgi:ferrous iron transport protein B